MSDSLFPLQVQERFEQNCQSTHPVSLRQFWESILKDFPSLSEKACVEILYRLIYIELQYAWTAYATKTNGPRAAKPWLLQDYACCFPELGPIAQWPLELIVQEYRMRAGAAEKECTAADYFARFPARAEALKLVLRWTGGKGEVLEHSVRAGGELPEPPSGHVQPKVDSVASVTPTPSSASAVQPRPMRLDQPMSPQIAGYKIVRRLGQGGMSVVYLARQIRLNRLVVLKAALGGSNADLEERLRFLREAEVLGRLQHPNIVQVFDVFEHEEQSYLVLEYVDGGSLARQIKHEPQPAWHAAQLLEILARALHAAHEREIIHRDLKPSNILLTAQGIPKVADFGLAKWADTSRYQLTQSGIIVGTANYMAPEQAVGGRNQVGPAADVYGLGAILYELLAGRPPFTGPGIGEVLHQVLRQPPVPPSKLVPSVPPRLEAICLRSLEKDPALRFPSAMALAHELHEFLEQPPPDGARKLDSSSQTVACPRCGDVSEVISSDQRKNIRCARCHLLFEPPIVPPGVEMAVYQILDGTRRQERSQNHPRQSALSLRRLSPSSQRFLAMEREANPLPGKSPPPSHSTVPTRKRRPETQVPALAVLIPLLLVSGLVLLLISVLVLPPMISIFRPGVTQTPPDLARPAQQQPVLRSKQSAIDRQPVADTRRMDVSAPVSAPALMPAHSPNGLKMSLFLGSNFDAPVATRVGSHVDWLCCFDAPDPAIGTNPYSVRWEGWLRPPQAGYYKLITVSSEGVRLWLDGSLVIDDWNRRVAARDSIPIYLFDKPYPLRLDYHHDNASAMISLRWELQDVFPQQVIQPQYLFPDEAVARAESVPHGPHPSIGGLETLLFKGHFWEGKVAKKRTDWQVDWLWAQSPPQDVAIAKEFSVLWLGKLHPLYAGPYKFIVVSDGGVRLSLDGKLVIDNWSSRSLTKSRVRLYLEVRRYPLRLEYFHDTQNVIMSLRWQVPGSTTEEPIPPEAFSYGD